MLLHYPEAMKPWQLRVLAASLALCLVLGGCSGRGELPDLAAIEDVAQMKQTFYDSLYPVVTEHNARILEQRAELAEIRELMATGERPGWLRRRSLQALAEEYELEWDSEELEAIADRLWRRVDVIPTELALAQAAKESGWGRSRFAVEINNLFGHWCYEPGCGVVPAQRSATATHEVAAFDSVSESIRRYMNNLNTHERYVALRRLRAERRLREQPLTGDSLAPGLIGYSQRGAPYVEEILSMMQQNQELLDQATSS